jgi:hypothetical protein
MFDEVTRIHITEQTVADLQNEWATATTVRGRMLALGRGYVAFWSVVMIAPVALRQSPHSGRSMSIFAATVLVALAVGLAFLPPTELLQVTSHFIDGLTNVTLTRLGAVAGWVFLTGPLALMLLFVARRRLVIDLPGLGFSTAVLLSLLPVTAACALGATNFLATFQEIGRTGSAGFRPVLDGVTLTMSSITRGVASTTACLMVVLVLMWRNLRTSVGTSVDSGSRLTPVAFLVALMIALAGADQLLRLHHQMNQATLVLLELDPAIRLQRGGFQAAMDSFEKTVILAAMAGAFMSVAFAAAAVLAWRTFLRSRVIARLVQVVAAVALAGAAWHTGVLRNDQQALEVLAKRAASSVSTAPRRQ